MVYPRIRKDFPMASRNIVVPRSCSLSKNHFNLHSLFPSGFIPWKIHFHNTIHYLYNMATIHSIFLDLEPRKTTRRGYCACAQLLFPMAPCPDSGCDHLSSVNRAQTKMAVSVTGGLTRSERAPTSFHRKAPGGEGGRLAVLPGTRPSVRYGQLLLSSGLPSLDSVLGGGLALGTLLLIEEDIYGIYSNLLFKHFLAEGIVCGHNLFIASAKEQPADILKELPSPFLSTSVSAVEEKEVTAAMKCKQDSDESMKIAWRYQNIPKLEMTQTTFSNFGHYFDLSKPLASELIQNIGWHGFFLPEETTLCPDTKSCNTASGYTRLLHSIQKVIYQEGFDGSIPQKKQRNVLRIGIQNLGSILWGDDICCTENPQNIHSLTRFLYGLRGLLRSSLSACIITIPSHLIQNKAIMERVTNLSDTVVGLESFIGSERETNPLYKDYHGLIHIRQIPRLNSLTCNVSNTKDLAFRLKRKLFIIERLHLPPDLSDTVSRTSKQDLAEFTKLLSSGYSAMAIGKKHLDF